MEFNLLIVGDKSVGKSTFINRHVTGEFTREYVPTDGLKKSRLAFTTNQGKIIFNVYDGGYPAQVDCAIIMSDMTNKSTVDHVISYYHWIDAMFGKIPIVICGNKMDLREREVQASSFAQFLHDTYKDLRVLYFDTSARSNYNFEKPFLFLIRMLLNPALKSYQDLSNCGVCFV